MNTHIPQLMESRRELAVRHSSILVPELCLLAQVVNSFERTELSVFKVLSVHMLLALPTVKIHLLDLPFPERNHKGSGTKHVLGVILHETRKDFTKKA